MTDRPSLFVVALPRTLSSWVYARAARALGLAEPRWTTAGELLNGDRLVFAGDGPGGAAKFVRPGEARFAGIGAFLDDCVRPRGHAYKDVVQPFAVAAWLAGADLPVLRVRRRLADVADACVRRGWDYPAAPGPGDALDRLLLGLREASAALDALRAPEVRWDDLVVSDEPLREALASLYGTGAVFPADARERVEDNVGGAGTGRPDRSGGRLAEVWAPCPRVADARGPRFAADAERALRRRESAEWQAIDARARALLGADAAG